MKRKQVINKLRIWNRRIEHKIIVLQRAAKIYSFISITTILSIAILSATLIALSALTVTDNANSPVFITILVLQVVLAGFSAIDAALSPKRKASDCSVCSKQYQELNREIAVTIDDLFRIGDDESMALSEVTDDLSEKYVFLSLLYSSKEQLILQSEPMMFFTKMGNQLVDNLPANENEMNRRGNPV